MSWAAGIQYDGDTVRASAVLANMSTWYPSNQAVNEGEATATGNCYEVAGFFVRPLHSSRVYFRCVSSHEKM